VSGPRSNGTDTHPALVTRVFPVDGSDSPAFLVNVRVFLDNTNGALLLGSVPFYDQKPEHLPEDLTVAYWPPRETGGAIAGGDLETVDVTIPLHPLGEVAEPAGTLPPDGASAMGITPKPE